MEDIRSFEERIPTESECLSIIERVVGPNRLNRNRPFTGVTPESFCRLLDYLAGPENTGMHALICGVTTQTIRNWKKNPATIAHRNAPRLLAYLTWQEDAWLSQGSIHGHPEKQAKRREVDSFEEWKASCLESTVEKMFGTTHGFRALREEACRKAIERMDDDSVLIMSRVARGLLLGCGASSEEVNEIFAYCSSQLLHNP